MRKIYLISSLVLLASVSRAQQVMMQGWYWDYPKTAGGYSWADTLRLKAASLKASGITHMWFPPHTVASFGTNSNGYDPKDLFIGNQSTGLGTRSALNNMLAEFTARGIAPVADMVYNHRDGGSPEVNSAVKDYVTNYYNAAKEPFPSDRYRIILPLGGASGNGAGDYYFKLSSKTGDGRFNNYGYKIYMETKTKGYQGTPDLNEAEPNGGGDCGQGNNDLPLGKNMFATLETGGGCNTDEFHVNIGPADYNAAGDTLYIYMNNTGGYSDHRFYGLWSASRGMDIVNDLRYQTYTDFSNMPSGRGQMNFEFFKPNSSNASTTFLAGDWDGMYFFYDYDQFQKRTQDTLIEWTKWNWDELGVRGLRMDAIKHFTPAFVGKLLDSMHHYGKDPGMVVGEWYGTNTGELSGWINNVKANMSPAAQAAIQPKIFDFALREQLRQACDNGGFDVRNVFTGSLHDAAGVSGFNAVTFVNNHDFRDASGFASLIRNNTDLAYAYILTNNQLGVPTVFYPDYYGYPAPSGGLYSYHPTTLPAYKPQIDDLMGVLKLYINGSPSIDYLNRFSTPYSSNYISGSASRCLIYQLEGSALNGFRDVIVAINFGDTRLQADHQVNNRGGALAPGTRFYDALGNSAFAYQQMNGASQVYFDLPAKSYSVWVQSTGPLPLSLLSFSALPSGNDALLQWQVSDAANTQQYRVERSYNGRDFTRLGEVTAGSSTVYQYTDRNITASGTIYYRLQLVQKNGTVQYSDIVKIKMGDKTFSIQVAPNPIEDSRARVLLTSPRAGTVTVAVIGSNGQKLWQQQLRMNAGTNSIIVPAANLPSGRYTLIASTDEGNAGTVFIKQ